jgi:hypothetical protein
MDRHLFGLNPDYKEFMDKRPGITLLGLGWGMYWRFTIVVLAIEAVLFAAILALSTLSS